MRITYMGSGAFGRPTIERLAAEHEIGLVVSQPARPAGRRRTMTPTPIAAWAEERGIETFTPERLDADAVARIRAAEADAQVVIAYGHKLPPALTEAAFSVNLHASLLPRWRGAAPINHAMIAGDHETGVSVISLARRMDAGLIYGVTRTAIDPSETAGELHDRLSAFGPALVAEVLAAHVAGSLEGATQDPAAVTSAPKLSRADAVLDFTLPADRVRARLHGLTPWPGCSVAIDGHRLKLTRAAAHPAADASASHAGHGPGTIDEDGFVICGDGRLELVEVCPAGKRAMPFADFRRGHAIDPGTPVQSPADGPG